MRALFLLLLHLSILLHPSSPSPVLAGKKSRGTDAVEQILRREESLRAPPSVQLAAAQGVLRRLLPRHTSSFLLKVVPKGLCESFSCFRIGSVVNSSLNGPEIMIEGSTAVEVSSGLHWYLKYWCGAHISWDKTGGVQVDTVPSPGSLPRVEGQGVKVERPVPWNYYQNVVTSSYSFAWWDWKRWEKEIDWMALQGVNLPLAFNGQEAIWKKVFKDFDVGNEDLGNFFGGPAFLAWARMGNLHGWGGPLSQNWLDQQLNLQKLILPRMIELGMTPVLPAFSGNVPAIFRKIFPTANITRLSNWNTVNGDPRWCCTYLLDPSDPLFIEAGRAFIKQQIKGF
ncbi:alpha-N-acetylglucosaminidase [Dendrobium catenatum]|uniref:Alpha-N-acetylglucosaminidase n=1 Tax=Dendrobium catenatum TaxID=906689 RepID=A0A2I0VNN7_9ASPA|nr:alpha-N-acetylglucosaminidase [Dendrobium catenatum]